MKMRKHTLRMVSVFFLVLMLAGCGIKTVFTVDYVFASNTFTFTDPMNSLSWITPSTGPSLLLSYLVSTESAPPSSIASKFNSEFRRLISDGRMIPSDSEILSVTSGSETYSLYKFTDSNALSQNAPYFLATATNPTNPDLEFSLSLNADDTLQFTIVSGSYLPHTSGSLTRFNGLPFETEPGTIINSSENDYPDYVVPNTGGTLYLHVYAATNVSEGDFNTIYWTKLEPVVSIQLN